MKENTMTPGADKKEFLLEQAGSLFAEHGFDGTSIRMIAEKSGMNVAMVSYYFGSKEKLYEELISAKISYMREQLNALVENKALDPWKKMEIVIDGYAERIIKTGGAFHRLMMREISLGQRSAISKMIEEKIMFNMQAIHSIVQEGVRKKIFASDLDFPMLMSMLFGSITQTVASDSIFCRFMEIEGKKGKKINASEQTLRVQNHLKKVFARYMLIHPSKYKY